jgi:hypothetical protein
MRRKASLNLAKFAACLPSVGFYTQTAEQGTSHSFAAESGSIRSTDDPEPSDPALCTPTRPAGCSKAFPV